MTSITVWRDYSNPNVPLPPPDVKNSIIFTTKPTKQRENEQDLNEGISNYQIDYLIIHFDQMIEREIKKNPDIIYNSNFQKFMQSVMEFRRIVLESRADPNGMARGPFGGPLEQYQCPQTHNYHKLDPEYLSYLSNAIQKGDINPKKYYNFDGSYVPPETEIKDPPETIKDESFRTAYFDKCKRPETIKLIEDLILPTQNSWESFQASQTVAQPDENILGRLGKLFEHNLAETNNAITNGDYSTNYTIIETKLKDTVQMLEHLAESTNTEVNVIGHATDIDGYYEKLAFKTDDIPDKALQKSDDPVDLVDYDQIKTNLAASISKASNMSTAGVIASAYNIRTGIENIKNVGAVVSNLWSALASATNIANPSQALLDLTMTKIYIDKDGHKVAKYLTDKEIDDLRDAKINEQMRYLNAFSTGSIDDVTKYQNKDSRLERYQAHYQPDPYQTGGKKNGPKYTFRKKSNGIPITQSGGRDLDADKLRTEGKRISDRINEINHEISAVDKMYHTQEELYLENEQFMSPEGLQQKNQYLIEMMNIIQMYQFLVATKTGTYTNFFHDLQNQMKNFKKLLTETWDIIQARTVAGTTPDQSILDKLLANAILTTSEVQSLLRSIGVDIQIRDVTNNAIINHAEVMKVLAALQDKYGINNIAMIADDLYKLETYASQITRAQVNGTTTVEKLYHNLYNYYTTIKSLNTRLLAEYRSLDATTVDFRTINQFTGDAIKSNLMIANTFIQSLIFVLQSFGVKTGALESIRRELTLSKRQFTDFETLLKEASYRLRNKNILKTSHDDVVNEALAKPGMDPTYLSEFYQTYMDNYTTKLINTSMNVVPYYSTQKDLQHVEEQKDILQQAYIEFSAVENAVMSKNTNKSKLDQLIISSNADVSTDFNKFADNVYSYLNYFNDTELPNFRKLMARINLGADVAVLFDRFVFSSVDNIKTLLTTYFTWTNNQLDKVPGMTIHDQYTLAKDIAKNYQKILNISDPADKNGIRKEINMRINKLMDDQTDSAPNLQNLVDYLSNQLNNNQPVVSKNTIVSSIKDYLNRIYYLMGNKEDSPRNVADAVIIRDSIIKQLNTVTASLFNLYYDKLSRLYYLFTSLIVINNPNHPAFINIVQDQRAITSLSSQPKKLSLIPFYQEVTNSTSQRLLPIKIRNSNANKCPYCFINARFRRNLHNLMNVKSNTHPYILMVAERTNIPNQDISYHTFFYQIRNDYQTFSRRAIPLLEMMRQMIENGQNIVNTQKKPINLSEYSLLRKNLNLFTSPFIYSTNGMTEKSNIINSYNSFLLSNGSTNNHIALHYTQDLMIYLPMYDKDRIVTSSTTTTVEYQRANDDLSYSITITDQTVGPVDIAVNSNITSYQLSTLIKLVNTGNYLFHFMSELWEIVDIIRVLNVEPIDSWDKSITETSVQYATRTTKKRNLVTVLNVLEKISQTIRDNNNYFHLDKVMTSANIMYARIRIESINPTSSTFNETVDKIWLFARKLTNAWYSIFGHMLTSLLLNETVNHIVSVISLLGNQIDPKNATKFISLMDVPNILKMEQFQPYHSRINKYFDTVNNELEFAKNRLTSTRDRYPIAIDPGLPNGINQNIMDVVKFDQYYSNMEHGSNRVYVILLVTKKDKVDEIIIPLKNVAITTNDIVDLVNVLEKYLSKEYLNTAINVHTDTINFTIDTLKMYANNLINSVLREIETDLKRIKMGDFYDNLQVLVNQKRENLVARIATGEENDPNFAAGQGTNLMDLDSDTPFTIEQLNTEMTSMEIYQYHTTQFINNEDKEHLKIILNLVLTDVYRICFGKFLPYLSNKMDNINSSIGTTQVEELDILSQAFFLFFNRKNINQLYPNPLSLSEKIKKPSSNSNGDQIKAIIYSADDYLNNKIALREINDVLSSVLRYVSSDLAYFYQDELENYQKLLSMDTALRASIRQNQQSVQEQIQKIRSMIDIISLVMFNPYFKKYAFIDSNEMPEYVANVIDNYETIWRMIETKLRNIIVRNNRHLLILGQINNYIAFKATINKRINNKAIVSKFYRKISFGIIEFYYNVLDSILQCLETKPFEEMGDIETYLYKYHYIQIKRCFALFRWLNLEFKKNKQQEDLEKKSPISVLNKKIIIEETRGDVELVFTEFHGLRKYLDDYSAVVMAKVQLHLRINDFADQSYNNILKTEAISQGDDRYNLLRDVDPIKEPLEYQKRFNENELMFDNSDNDRILKINFPLLQKIHQINNPGAGEKPFDIYYQAIWDKMESGAGIEFERIYNTLTFPDSDVISNYMAIAPNINLGKGTVIMTYGYSGVGKTASLFGRPGSNGILQATFDQFTLSKAGQTGIEIYFRVYEIYGHGVQYNYYWNPENGANCYPEFSQYIIHHDLDNSGPVLGINGQMVFSNRHDMLAYILTLKDPRTGLKDPANNIPFSIVNRKESFGNDVLYNKYVQKGTLIKSPYILLREEQYRTFNQFVGKIDYTREKNGVKLTKLLTHIVTQVKGTINNPVSSRSILVYDFQINLDPSAKNQIYIPFVIYDLPGKEDVAGTYVNINEMGIIDPNVRMRVFRDLPDDPGKAMKSTYVQNPLLMPIYGDNIVIIENLLRAISHTGKDPAYDKKRFGHTFEANLLKEILDYEIDNFYYKNYEFQESGAKYKVRSLYINTITFTDIGQLFNHDNFIPVFFNPEVKFDQTTGKTISAFSALTLDHGIISTANFTNTEDFNKDGIIKELKILVSIIVIAFLIKNQLFDVLVEMIAKIVNGSGDLDNPNDGGWSRNKIYAFFEAYYINENVVGLLQYLIKTVLGKQNTNIEPQDTIKETISHTINTNYRTANRYRILYNRYLENKDNTVGNNYNLKVNIDLIEHGTNTLKNKEIDEFMEKYKVEPSSGIFAHYRTLVTDALERMRGVITFENKGKYNNNKIFRSGEIACNIPNADKDIYNPFHALYPTDTNIPKIVNETNRPLLQDLFEPYEQKISFYYVFYVLSNSQMKNKAEEQVKLLNNSMPFVVMMEPSSKKKLVCN